MVVLTGGVYFQTGLFRVVCGLLECLAMGVVGCGKREQAAFFCGASTAVGSTRPGKTEPQEQQQLGAAVHPVITTVQVP
jgi:hypothetical protein